jgi:Protein of unknown function (DUF1566)
MHTAICAGTFMPALGLIILLATGCGHGIIAGADEIGDDGTVDPGGECTGSCDPLCVDAGRYRVIDHLVEDTSAGSRLWQRAVGARLPWVDAEDYCAALTLDGLEGFRLPSPDELRGIRYDPGGLFGEASSRHYCVPSIDQSAFPDTPAREFWTSLTMPDDTAWYVDFADGRSHRDTLSDPLWVRCTRDGA